MRVVRHITAFMACIMLFPASHAVQLRREPGYRIPESILPTDIDNPALWAPASGSILTRAAAPGDYAVNDIPRLGTIEYPLVLVDFKNRGFSIQDPEKLVEQYERMFNEHGYSDPNKYFVHGNAFFGATGSVSDYFRDQSYGLYTPKFKIIGPVHLSRDYEYYGNGKYDKSAHVDELVHEICDSIVKNGLANLAGYSDNGRLHQLSIIYAGRGENYVGSDANTIWPQASIMYTTKKDSVYSKGIYSIRYACTCELFWDSDTILDGIGTFCHEFSHTLGLPDFYNTSSESQSESNAAMGYWSLMDYGNYENLGFSPVGYTAFEKYSLGWLELQEINNAGPYYLTDISREPNPEKGEYCAYRLSTLDENQFIILENHRKTGWYKYHKAEGLMVTAVDYDKDSWVNTNKVNTSTKRYQILPADNNYNRNTNDGDLFPYEYSDSTGTHVTDSISTMGKPALKAGSSYPSLSIYNIKKEGVIVTFRAGFDLPSGITNTTEQKVTMSITDGELSVTAPMGSTVTIHDISGKIISVVTTSEPTQQIALPSHGIWIVKCGDVVRKIQK